MCMTQKFNKIKKQLSKAKHCFQDYSINRRATKTSHKYLIIESDDWGSIRTPNSNVLKELEALGDNPYSEPFIRNDSLENADDLYRLFECLSQYSDSNGRKLAITANFAMANADFSEIKKTGRYCREPFYDTYAKYYGDKQTLDIIRQGIATGLFKPQLHCLEHLRVNKWMEDFHKGKSDVVVALEKNMYGIGNSHTDDNRYGYMDAFNYSTNDDKDYISKSISTACNLFEKVFGYKSESFTASCYVWDSFFEKELIKNGIYHIQTGARQILPRYSDNGKRYRKISHYTGEKNKLGQVYTVRNCEYEPSLSGNLNYHVNRCIESIEHSFAANSAAIISSHRFNFINSVNYGNGERGLHGLKTVMDWVMKNHPDVEFLTSDEYGRILLNDYVKIVGDIYYE